MNTNKMSNALGPDQDQFFVSPDLDPNCLQRLSADDKKSQLAAKELSEHLPDQLYQNQELQHHSGGHPSEWISFPVSYCPRHKYKGSFLSVLLQQHCDLGVSISCKIDIKSDRNGGQNQVANKIKCFIYVCLYQSI